jgi:hypothetical protein
MHKQATKFLSCSLCTTQKKILPITIFHVGRASLRVERSGNRISVGGRFSAPVQTGYPAFYTMGTRSFFPEVKRKRRGFKYPPPCSTEVKESVELYLCSPSGPSWPVLGRTLPLFNSFPLLTTVTGSQSPFAVCKVLLHLQVLHSSFSSIFPLSFPVSFWVFLFFYFEGPGVE